MNLLLHPKIDAYLYKNPEHQNRIEKEVTILKQFDGLKELLKEQKQGKLFFPMYHDMCGFLSLHLLGLNPMNPLAFQVVLSSMYEDAAKAETYFGFYTSHEFEQQYVPIECMKLDVLELSFYAARYYGKTQDELVALVSQQQHKELLLNLIHSDETANQYWFLDAAVRQHLAKKEIAENLLFDDLVRLVFEACGEANIGREPNDLAVTEVYMELFLEAWKRGFLKI